jgi:PAS domain S-box-containing protein
VQDIEERAARRGRRAGIGIAIGFLLLVGIAVAGVLLVLRFVADQRAHDLLAWQTRLSIIADSRKADVQAWLDRQFAEIGGLAENASLQLYMAQLIEAGGAEPDATGEQPFEAEYLANLLTVAAERSGFAPPRGPTVEANVAVPPVAGLALVDGQGRPLVATAGMPPIEGRLKDFVTKLAPGTRGVLDLHIDATGQPAMAFAAPVYGVQADRATAKALGLVVGVKQVAAELYPLLRQPGETLRTARATLVRRTDESVEYLSPLEDGTPPLSLRLSLATPELDAAFAVKVAGGFAIRRDHNGREVLVATRTLRDVPWTLMYSVERSEALADSDTRTTRLLVILLLAVAAVAAALLAAWWQGASRRAAESAERHRLTAERLEAQRRLLRLVTDSQPTEIAIFDTEGRFRFANKAVAEKAGLAPEELAGKPLENVVGPAAAEPVLALNRKALEAGHAVEEVRRDGTGGRVLRSSHVPVPASDGEGPGVLVVEEDLTEAFRERERRERLQEQLVRALVGVVDRRDPFAAEHSARVAKLARAIAVEMGLKPLEISAAETAGELLNLGKILVEPTLLTRGTELSEEERHQIRRAMLASADLLQGVEFDGPVVETLRQSLARWDGTGVPPGLAGEDILPSARVVALANAFVGMLSPRAHRAAMTLDGAIDAVMAEAGRAFDRRAVAALVNYLDNRGGRAEWQRTTS